MLRRNACRRTRGNNGRCRASRSGGAGHTSGTKGAGGRGLVVSSLVKGRVAEASVELGGAGDGILVRRANTGLVHGCAFHGARLGGTGGLGLDGLSSSSSRLHGSSGNGSGRLNRDRCGGGLLGDVH